MSVLSTYPARLSSFVNNGLHQLVCNPTRGENNYSRSSLNLRQSCSYKCHSPSIFFC